MFSNLIGCHERAMLLKLCHMYMDGICLSKITRNVIEIDNVQEWKWKILTIYANKHNRLIYDNLKLVVTSVKSM